MEEGQEGKERADWRLCLGRAKSRTEVIMGYFVIFQLG